MATENEVAAAKVRALEALATLLEVCTELARAAVKELSDRGGNGSTEAGAARRGRS